MTNISLVLTTKFPDSEWVLTGTEYEGLDWLDESPKPTKKQLEDLWPTVQSELEAKTTARQSALAKLAALGLTESEIAAL
jgi:DNA-binding NarL/FixJ family response regulator